MQNNQKEKNKNYLQIQVCSIYLFILICLFVCWQDIHKIYFGLQVSLQIDEFLEHISLIFSNSPMYSAFCLLYTSDAADDMQCVDLGGRRIIKKKKEQTSD
eukprot:TRINITY_DN25591_c0_g1_i1.p3 TRINITY_DN25591_c0_g1~~TRINITY_DN25591_c0_g1_i1.p3  ORF type:complete len:101 (-),score=17.91 TRINITY_DN25591_c0_g1_i1:107-409(-)